MSSIPKYVRIRITNSDEDVARLRPLVNEFIQFPERANSVKEFIWRCPDLRVLYLTKEQQAIGKLSEEKEAERSVTGEETLRAALQRLELGDEEDKWIRHLTWTRLELGAERGDESNEDDSFSTRQISLYARHAGALLLMLCPNIERLTYEDNAGPLASVLLRNNYKELPEQHLRKLREVTLLPVDNPILNDPRFYADMDILNVIRLFHQLPALEKIDIAGIQPYNGLGFNDEITPGSSNASIIHLCHTELPTCIAGAIIRMSKHLKEFILTEGGRATNDSGHFIRYSRTIAQALFCHKDTLHKLDLDLDGTYCYNLDVERPEDDDDDESDESSEDFSDRSIGSQDTEPASNVQDGRDGVKPKHTWELEEPLTYRGVLELQDFCKLTHLSIGIVYLLGPRYKPIHPPVRLLESLPKSLQYLMIRGYVKGECPVYDVEVEMLLTQKSTRLPHLIEIHGLDTCIPSGEAVDDVDNPDAPLWEPVDVDADWVELTETTGKEKRDQDEINAGDTHLFEPSAKRIKI